MRLEKEIKMLEALADGLDPITGKALNNQSPYNQPEVIRSLFTIITELKDLTKKINLPKKTVTEKQAKNIKKGLPKNTGFLWKKTDQRELIVKYKQGVSIKKLAETYDRTSVAILSQLQKQGVILRG